MEDKVKRLAEMKSYLEKKIRELEDEIGLLREMLALIDQQLARDSFKPASQLLREKTEKTVTPVQVERESNIHSRKIGGKVIGKLVYRGNQIILRPLEPINTSDPLFRNFFVMNVLEKFKQEDMERAASGEILEEEGFKYRVKQSSKGMLEEIVIMNVRDDKRIRELKGAFRWMMETYLLRRKTQS